VGPHVCSTSKPTAALLVRYRIVICLGGLNLLLHTRPQWIDVGTRMGARLGW
jgi:hypothetical protein